MTRRALGPLFDGLTPREQRLAAGGRVAAGMLHDMRNQLGTISNLAFVLEHVADDPEKVRDLARRLAELAHVRTRVMDRLRDFVRQDAARFADDAVIDLSAVVREAAALCAPLAAAQDTTTQIVCDVPAPVPVAGEGADLRAAVFELVLNALEASPHSGTIQVCTRSDGVRAVVEVRDEGNGPSDGMAETAFDPFISSKEEPDAGLGLSAAYAIARRHGGDLTIGPGVSRGTVVVLSLPLLTRDA